MGKGLQTLPEALRETVERWLARYGDAAYTGPANCRTWLPAANLRAL